MTMMEAEANITPTVNELNTVITAAHLVSDYALSRNIARFGLKFVTLMSLWKKHGLDTAQFFHHEYCITREEKSVNIRNIIKQWKI